MSVLQRIVYNDHQHTFKELLERDNSFTIHRKNLQKLAIEMFKVSASVQLVRDCRQKTFGFLNRLCLLISNPLPPLSLTDSLDFSIQHRYLILILALVTHTYTIHTCIYTVYIPILYLFDTRILYFFTVLYFNKKYI